MTFFITPFHYTDCFSVRQIGYGGKEAYEKVLDILCGAVADYVEQNPDLRNQPTEDMWDFKDEEEDQDDSWDEEEDDWDEEEDYEDDEDY